ncbi:MAG: hypothetical protein NDJ90_04065 [Oligoflexia bacterium]|nr:hypothetical protein [Oligoflexia bacterium]
MKPGTFFRALWDDDRGQSTTEYILMLSVVVMIAIRFKGMFQKTMEKAVGQLESDITGAMSGGE